MGDDLQDYREFILELLRAEEESGRDVAVIYPLLKARQHLLNPQFAKALSLMAAEFSTSQPEKLLATVKVIKRFFLGEKFSASQPKKLQAILPHLENLSIDISDFSLGSRANNLEIAIVGYEIVLNHRQPGSEKYAQTQNNLAIAYCDRINGSRAENLERAIEYYQAALTVRTREDFPEQWADTQNNLANAYRNRINTSAGLSDRGSRADNLERAIEYYQAALTVRTREDFPEKWAMTQNNLAVAYSDRINGSRAENLERAIEYFQLALTVRTREDFPEDWAITQNNLAVAYSDRINGSRADNLERAIEYYQAALTVRTREDFPEKWAIDLLRN